MTLTVRESQNIDKFFDAIAYKMDGYLANTFRYIAAKEGNEFSLRQVRLFLNTGALEGPVYALSVETRASWQLRPVGTSA